LKIYYDLKKKIENCLLYNDLYVLKYLYACI